MIREVYLLPDTGAVSCTVGTAAVIVMTGALLLFVSDTLL